MKFFPPALLLACLILSCDPRNRRAELAGRMEVEWGGSAKGSITAPATATWCEVSRLLEIRSIRGDTGIALAVYPTRARITSGSYPIVEPSTAESVPPAAGVAMRWLTRNVVQGFRGDSGRLALERSRTGQLSGEVSARARSVVDTQRITLTARFRDLTPKPDSLGCTAADSVDEELPDDSGEEADTMVD